METNIRAILDRMFPRTWPSRYRRRRKLSPLKKKRGGMWNPKPFLTRSNKKRATAVIQLKNKIRMQNPLLGRRFFGGDELIDSERPWQYQQDSHVYFCGTDKRVYWNAYICTAKMKFWEIVSDIALKRAKGMLSKEEREREFVCNFTPVAYDAWGYPTLFTMDDNDLTYPQFDGLSFDSYKDKLEAEIIVNEPPEVHESFKIDNNFEEGVGLYVVVDAEYISREVVERIIDRFFAIGETDWQSEAPVLRERLPYETENEFLMTVPPEKR